MSDELERTLADAKKSMAPKGEPDWDAIDAKLFARIDAEERAEESARVARIGAGARGKGWSLVAGGLAFAAAAAVYVVHKPGAAPLENASLVLLSLVQPQPPSGFWRASSSAAKVLARARAASPKSSPKSWATIA